MEVLPADAMAAAGAAQGVRRLRLRAGLQEPPGRRARRPSSSACSASASRRASSAESFLRDEMAEEPRPPRRPRGDRPGPADGGLGPIPALFAPGSRSARGLVSRVAGSRVTRDGNFGFEERLHSAPRRDPCPRAGRAFGVGGCPSPSQTARFVSISSCWTIRMSRVRRLRPEAHGPAVDVGLQMPSAEARSWGRRPWAFAPFSPSSHGIVLHGRHALARVVEIDGATASRRTRPSSRRCPP